MPNISQINTGSAICDIKDAFMRSITPSSATTTNKLITQLDSDVTGVLFGDQVTLTDAADARLQRLKIFGTSEVINNNIVSTGSETGDITMYCGSTVIDLVSQLPLHGIDIVNNDTEYNNERPFGHKYLSDIYDSAGKVIRYTVLIDLGDLTWTKNNGNTSTIKYFNTTPSRAIKPVVGTQNQIIFDLLVSGGYSSDKFRNIFYGANDKIVSLANGQISVYDSALVSKDVDEFKAAMTGIKLLYQVETPYEDQISATDLAELRKFTTSTNSTTIGNTSDDYFEATYLKNTVTGQALALIQNDLQAQIDALNNA